MTEKELDKEWIRLIAKAKEMGIPTGEIRTFLQQASKMETGVAKLEK